MNITATDAKNRLGQVLEQAQLRPVVIEKSGRPHSVVLSIGQYEALVRASRPAEEAITTSAQFYARYKDWIDEQNRLFDERGLWNDDLRLW